MTGRAVLLLSLGAFASAAALRASDPLLPLIAAAFGTAPGAPPLQCCLLRRRSSPRWTQAPT
jgi:hypothetical protein